MNRLIKLMNEIWDIYGFCRCDSVSGKRLGHIETAYLACILY